MLLLLLIFIFASNGFCSQDFDGSGEDETLIDEYWLQRLIENVEIPKYLMQKAYQLAGDSKNIVDETEILTLDASVPALAKKIFTDTIINTGEDQISLKNATDHFMAVIFYAFRPFGCDQDNMWPSVYNLTKDNLECIAFSLIDKIYSKSEFTRKYFARAIHFGITSTAPIKHRIHEISVYQFLLPNQDRVWFNNLKFQLKNSLWNEQEVTKLVNYEDNSFGCGTVPFTDEIQEKIDFYYPK